LLKTLNLLLESGKYFFTFGDEAFHDESKVHLIGLHAKEIVIDVCQQSCSVYEWLKQVVEGLGRQMIQVHLGQTRREILFAILFREGR